jgi:AcrR family transcriptional regulator
MPSRRRQILDAALRGFAERGLAGTTVEEVRRRSGASVGSIYHHFGDKEGIAAALYVESLRDYQDGLQALLAGDGAAEETVKGLVRYHLRWVEADHDRARFLLAGPPPRAAEGIAEVNRDARRATSRWLAGRVDAGELRDVPLDLFYSILIGPAQEFCRFWLRGRMRTSIRAAEDQLGLAAWLALAPMRTG